MPLALAHTCIQLDLHALAFWRQVVLQPLAALGLCLAPPPPAAKLRIARPLFHCLATNPPTSSSCNRTQSNSGATIPRLHCPHCNALHPIVAATNHSDTVQEDSIDVLSRSCLAQKHDIIVSKVMALCRVRLKSFKNGVLTFWQPIVNVCVSPSNFLAN